MLERDELERKHALMALQEMSVAMSAVIDASLAENFRISYTRIGRALSLLDLAMYRLSRLGTDREFNQTGKNAVEEATRIFKAISKPADAEWALTPIADKCMSVKEWLEAFSVVTHEETSSTMLKE